MIDCDNRFLDAEFEPVAGVAIAARVEEIWTAERCWIRELLNDPSRPEISLAAARVPPRVTTRLHRLHGVTERYLVQSGHGRLEFGDRSVDVGPGDVVEIAAGAPQRIENRGEEDLVFFCVCTPRFTPECYEDLEGGAAG